MTDTLKLTKKNPVFNTIQGEGIFVGRPSTFVRAFGCNLDCVWCDTKYSWDPNAESWGMTTHTVGEVFEIMSGQPGGIMADVIFTGGEPTLQLGMLTQLMDLINENQGGHRFTIETNGTRFHPRLRRFDLVSASPKPWRFKRDMEELELITVHAKQAQFKVVVQNEQEVKDSIDLFAHLFVRVRDRIWKQGTGREVEDITFILQPETSKGKEWFQKVAEAARLSYLPPDIRRMVRVLPQVHALLGVE